MEGPQLQEANTRMELDAAHSKQTMYAQWAEELAPREKMLDLLKVTLHPGSLALGS